MHKLQNKFQVAGYVPVHISETETTPALTFAVKWHLMYYVQAKENDPPVLHDPLRSTQTAHRNYAYLWTLFAHAQGDASRATVPSIAGCIARCVGAMYTNTNRITLLYANALAGKLRSETYLRSSWHCNTMLPDQRMTVALLYPSSYPIV